MNPRQRSRPGPSLESRCRCVHPSEKDLDRGQDDPSGFELSAPTGGTERAPGTPGTGPTIPRGHPEEPCRNCGDPTPGAFCPSCGQRKVATQISLKVLVKELARDQFGVEGRLPRTLGTLFFRPGLLTRDYLDGRVARYIRPFKLYLVSSLLLFLLVGLLSMRGVTTLDLSPWGTATQPSPDAPLLAEDLVRALWAARGSPEVTEALQDADSPEEVARILRALEEPGETVPERDPSADTTEAGVPDPESGEDLPLHERVQVNTGNARVDALIQTRLERLGRMDPAEAIREVVRTFLSYLPTLMFLLLPVFAGILKILYLRGPHYYAGHFVFVLHTHTFIFGTFTLSLLLGWAGLGFFSPLLLAWAAVYLYLALRRVYGQGHVKTAVKYWCLGWLYLWVLVLCLPLMVILSLFPAGG